MERRALLLRLTAPFSAQRHGREQDRNPVANNLHVPCCENLEIRTALRAFPDKIPGQPSRWLCLLWRGVRQWIDLRTARASGANPREKRPSPSRDAPTALSHPAAVTVCSSFPPTLAQTASGRDSRGGPQTDPQARVFGRVRVSRLYPWRPPMAQRPRYAALYVGQLARRGRSVRHAWQTSGRA